MKSYAKETDEEMRQRSNRTFGRIAAGLPPTLAERYGYKALPPDPLAFRLQEAAAGGNWNLAARLTVELAKWDQRAG